MAARATWCLRPGQTLAYRHWDDEYVLYNDLSGDTHLLDDAAIVLLLALKQGAQTRDALAAVLKSEFDAGDADLDAETDELLRKLRHLYLVDSSAC